MEDAKPTSLDDLCERYGDDLLKMDGYDDCIVGVCRRFGQEDVLIYDQEKVIQKLMSELKRDGISDEELREEAVEFFEYNQIGAWMGDKTPAFLAR
jgi:hypothetical protein